jgi:Uma2 family endonuclease
VAYIGPARAQASYPRWIDGAPDLAVEVLSQGQYGPAYAYGKIREYFEAGAQLVWLVDRRRKEVRVYQSGSDEYVIYRNDAVLTLEPIVPGFALSVTDIFR